VCAAEKVAVIDIKSRWCRKRDLVVVVGAQSQSYINFALHVYLENGADLTLQINIAQDSRSYKNEQE
jgi:hypothetical protein